KDRQKAGSEGKRVMVLTRRYYGHVQGIGIGIGIGPALRKARLLRGKSIEEAARETRIRADYLQALERERFEALLGDVYVRGFLRSYSTYLGVDAETLLTIYRDLLGANVAALLEVQQVRPIRPQRSPLRQ